MAYDWTRHVQSRGGRSRGEVAAAAVVGFGVSKSELLDLFASPNYKLALAKRYLIDCYGDLPEHMIGVLAQAINLLELIEDELEVAQRNSEAAQLTFDGGK